VKNGVLGKESLLADRCIELRGVEVHNLKGIDLDIPRQKLVVFCGVSGSGKTSLALDTLYAEGQRRYIESFSAYTRQFLDRLEKPAAERIDGIPPAIAVTRKNATRSSRSTVGTATETSDYLRLLFSKIGRVYCRRCGVEVRRETPQSVGARLARLADGTRFMLAFRQSVAAAGFAEASERLLEDGFVRAIVGDKTIDLSTSENAMPADPDSTLDLDVVVDRLVAGNVKEERLRDSLEITFEKGGQQCLVLIQAGNSSGLCAQVEVDGRTWVRESFSADLACDDCGIQYPTPEPRLYGFNSPLGACPQCEGFGNIMEIDMELVVPDPSKSIREGAIAPWNTPAYAHELEELLALAGDYSLPVDIPFSELQPQHIELIRNGVPERDFGGLQGFFNWLERRKYKMHLRVFLSRWRSYKTCPTCNGTRLRDEALATQVGGCNIAELSHLKIDDLASFFQGLELTESEQSIGRVMLQQVRSRLRYLQDVGLGYLTLDRTLRTLSGGEAQRVALTSSLGSSLVNMLYVLDEPSVGLHPSDVKRLIGTIAGLRDRGNSVIVVEHEEAMIQAADRIIEIGPGAGDRGGEVVLQGSFEDLRSAENSLTGDYLFGRRGLSIASHRRQPDHGWVRLKRASGNNLKTVTVEFPLGVLCLVTGVSGSGKSTLVHDTLYGALCRRKRKDSPKPLPFDDIYGDGQIDDVVMVDQSPIARSPRSNPVTYIKAFDEIRAVFAETIDARTHNYTAGHFSFNVDGGRCTKCKGDGHIAIDMQFLADVYMRCSQCGGTRYRPEILDVTYRGRNIADVLEMTIREAFSFFRGRPKVQAKLKRLIDVGLDYLRLGQPANTLSSGEAQRLKLAGYLTSAKRNRTLFILDEPTTGLHFSDIVQLLDCFDALLSVGHSLIVVEHNLQLMKAADYIIDLGPGAAEDGGRVVAAGTPEKVAHEPQSITGRFLAEALADRQSA